MKGRSAVRPLLQWGLLAIGAVTLAVLLSDRSSSAQPVTLVQDYSARGGSVYAANCAVCHGTDGEGTPGTGVAAGPPVNDVDVAYVDQTIRTGRMPIHAIDLGVINDELSAEDREAVVSWMAEQFDLPGEIPVIGPGDPGRGHELYATNCAQCHGATGAGGISADGTYVRGVQRLDPVAVYEATRVGPFQMPAFDDDVLSDQDVNDIVAFVHEELSQATATPLGLSEINRVTMTVLAAALVLAVVGGVFVIARPVRVSKEDREAPGERAG
jgi:ubiquinol-cytochrome c reductase cytochrome c subunit